MARRRRRLGSELVANNVDGRLSWPAREVRADGHLVVILHDRNWASDLLRIVFCVLGELRCQRALARPVASRTELDMARTRTGIVSLERLVARPPVSGLCSCPPPLSDDYQQAATLALGRHPNGSHETNWTRRLNYDDFRAALGARPAAQSVDRLSDIGRGSMGNGVVCFVQAD